MFDRKIRNILTIGAVGIGLFGAVTHNAMFGYIFATALGVVQIYFHRQISDDFIKMYPTTNKTYIRWSVPIIGASFLIFGIGSLLGVLPDQF